MKYMSAAKSFQLLFLPPKACVEKLWSLASKLKSSVCIWMLPVTVPGSPPPFWWKWIRCFDNWLPLPLPGQARPALVSPTIHLQVLAGKAPFLTERGPVLRWYYLDKCLLQKLRICYCGYHGNFGQIMPFPFFCASSLSSSIPYICHIWYTTALFWCVKNTPNTPGR